MVPTTADRARDFLERGYRVDALDLSDAEAVRRASTILGSSGVALSLRLDDSERQYERDSFGKFSSTGEASEHASEHAELARVAAMGSSSSSARSRSRKAAESASLARVAHEHGDLATAARHAGDAERHSQAAIRHGGAAEWTVRERMVALREVERAKASGDHDHAARAAVDAAKAFGPTSAAGRRLYAEAQAHSRQTAKDLAASDAERHRVGESHRVGVGLAVRGETGGASAASAPIRAIVHSPEAAVRAAVESKTAEIERESRAHAETTRAAEPKPRGTTSTYRPTSVAEEETKYRAGVQRGNLRPDPRKGGESWYDHDRRMAAERQAGAAKVHATAQGQRDRFVVPPGTVPFPSQRVELPRAIALPHAAHTVGLPDPPKRRGWRSVFSRSDELPPNLTGTLSSSYDLTMAIRHDRDCPGDEGCDCDDDEDCEDDQECDEEEGCQDREDGADNLRRIMVRRYGPSLQRTPAIDLARRAALILGVDVSGLSEAGVIARAALRADAEWNEEDHPREAGKFASAGGGGGRTPAVEAIASGRTRAAADATFKARNPSDHAKAAGLHDEAASAHKFGSERGEGHKAVRAHENAARNHREAASHTDAHLSTLAAERAKSAAVWATNSLPDSGQSRAITSSKAANDHTERANQADTPAAHREAANAHGQAVTLNRAIGHSAQLSHHVKMSDDHEARAKLLESRAAKPAKIAAIDKKPTESHVAPQSGVAHHEHGAAHATRAETHAAAAKSAASGTTPAARASARKAAESAALAKVAADHGDHAGAKAHADAAERHAANVAAKAGGANSVKPTNPSVSEKPSRGGNPGQERGSASPHWQAYRAATDKASKDADAASARARKTGGKDDHRAAAELHSLAMASHRTLGGGPNMRYHSEQIDRHEQAAGMKPYQDRVRTADLASGRARDVSDRTKGASGHASAEVAHRDAAAAHRDIYDHDAAAIHVKAAEGHALAANSSSGSKVAAEARHRGRNAGFMR